jgi:hypothetical protein
MGIRPTPLSFAGAFLSGRDQVKPEQHSEPRPLLKAFLTGILIRRDEWYSVIGVDYKRSPGGADEYTLVIQEITTQEL